jgi:hypothetical protein
MIDWAALAVLCVCALLGEARAQWDSKKDYPIRIHLTRGCSDYLKARSDTTPQGTVDNTAYHFFVAGWFSALNMTLPDTVSVLPGGSTEAAMQWLENYCKANPFEPFVTAVVALTHDVYPKREKASR